MYRRGIVTQRQPRGPQFPRLNLGAAARLAAAVVAGSIIAGILSAHWLLLSPGAVLHGALWQPLTYAFIITGSIELLFDAIILVTIGGELERWWGPQRLTRFLVGVPVVAALATCLLALAFPVLRDLYFAGGTAMATAAWCAYGWSLGTRYTNFWGITVTGDQLALIGIGMVVMRAAFASMLFVLPDLITVALTYAFVRGRR
ncbi:MAG: rhomboid family intramembrane serine protease [Deltaproteobacteria bacterium]|nr:rhomboid family intramembrane serine protease [Deltaproteobacteria bacterium]MCW5802823.1 rhomboid family intramembrane serine protease [Deltaproteobacteria bacterium]